MSDCFATSWTLAHQAPLSMEFSRQECCSGCHFLVQRIFPIQGSNLCLLHWQADSFSTEPPRKPQRMECACVLSCFSCVQLFVTQWTIAHQAPLSLGFSRQEYWSGLPCPPPGDLPNQGSNPHLPHCRWILYHLSYQGSPRILEWVAYPFSMRTSQPWN